MSKILRIISTITIVVIFLMATLYSVTKNIEWKKATAGETVTVSTPSTRVAQKVEKSVYAILNERKDGAGALGSGFLYKVDNDRAYLLTNAHVVSEVKNLKVFFETGKPIEAEVIGEDANYDIAVVAIKKSNLPSNANVLSIAQDDLELGEEVVAIGTPLDLGFFNTTTFGVVSGKSRIFIEQTDNDERVFYNDFIQIDAAINHGNSGGPLFNMDGEVVGINARGFTGNAKEPVSNVGFSIPAYVIRGVLPYVEKGESKPVLSFGLLIDGLYSRSNSPITIKPNDAGNYVVGVERGTPAERAGFQAEDVVIEVDGKTNASTQTIFKKMFSMKKGESVEMKVKRKGETKTLNVTLDEAVK